jgi:HSP20 family protein
MLPLALRKGNRGLEPNWFDRELGRMFHRLWSEEGGGELLTGAYPVDIDEDDEAITLEAELPGFKPEEIDVTIDHGTLNIVAERKPEEKKGKKHLAERRFVRVERSFTLPSSVDENQIDAKLDGGVLKLRLTKTAESKPKRIELK